MLIESIQQLPLHKQSEAELEATREFIRQDLYHCAKYLCGYRDITYDCHGDMIEALMDESTRKLIVMPRGTFKTSIGCVAYPIWLLINNPNLRILLDSELYTNSKNMLREIKTHLESERFKQLFGAWKTRTWNEGEIIISPRTKPLKEASITCSGIGAQKTGQHYDIILADDLNSPANSNTPEACQKVVTHYRYYTSLLDPGGTLGILGTRYSANDLIGKVLRDEVGGIDAFQ